MYTSGLISSIGAIAGSTLKNFSSRQFQKAVFEEGWEQLELKQRVRRISNSIHRQMAGDFRTDVKALMELTAALHDYAGRDNTFEYIFLADYVEQFGLEHPKEAFNAMELITVLASCEYAVRPYIIADQAASLARMHEWTAHTHSSVRRLASEGCRPRLPWGMALSALKQQPAPILPILEALKNDESEFVRRSVANNLNDIAKDNPQVVREIAARWKGKSGEIDKILKHGCRTLLKKGDKEALALFGVGDNAQCTVRQLKIMVSPIVIGDYLDFSFSVVNEGDRDAVLRIEYEITYKKSGGKTGKKIFKISERTVAPGTVIEFRRRQSFADMTTRKHYEGGHRLSIVVNGVAKASAPVDVTKL